MLVHVGVKVGRAETDFERLVRGRLLHNGGCGSDDRGGHRIRHTQGVDCSRSDFDSKNRRRKVRKRGVDVEAVTRRWWWQRARMSRRVVANERRARVRRRLCGCVGAYRAQHGPWRECCAHSAQCTVASHCPREQRQRSAFSQDTAVVFIPPSHAALFRTRP